MPPLKPWLESLTYNIGVRLESLTYVIGVRLESLTYIGASA